MLHNQDFHHTLDELEKRVIYGTIAIKNLPPNSVLIVRDDELYSQTDETIKKITSFLQIEYDKSSISLYEHNKRFPNEGINDPVVKKYQNRIKLIQSTANKIIGQNIW